eukprot:TRINITY_DN97197_c0_g1_i1.p1 TRINITY_DN97197_c0_g1~~TRINITY_DN97197_c0_g1_i1.p1  ORF type:complete len:1160 (+),score=236.23 TRINITY_DN97197_c0_g1_i1:54-3533(+)
MAPTAFDLLRSWQRRARQTLYRAPAGQEVDESPGQEAGRPGSEAKPVEPARPKGPFQAGKVGTDARMGLWWIVNDADLLFFTLSGPQWPPCAAYELPVDASLVARCVAPLTGNIPSSPARAPSAVALFADMRLAVFSQEKRIDLPRLTETPLGQAPAFLRSAAAHPAPGAVGVVLVVGTQGGRLFSLFLKQNGKDFEVQAGSLWPCVPEQNQCGLFKRLRRSGADAQRSPFSLEDVPLLAEAVEILPAPPTAGAGALFAVLAWSEERLAFYAHPRSTAAPDLLWSVAVSQLVAGGPSTRLLSVCRAGEEAACSGDESLLLLYTGRDAQLGSNASLLGRLSWTSRASPPELSAQQAVTVGPPPLPQQQLQLNECLAFVTAFGEGAVTAVRTSGSRCVMCMIRVDQQSGSLLSGEQQFVESGIVGLSLLPESGAAGHVQVLTSHGLLKCPTEPDPSSAGEAGTETKSVSSPDSFIQVARELFVTGREDQASSLCARAFSQHGAQAMLAAVDRRTKLLLDETGDQSGTRWAGVSADATSRHLLFDKARDLEAWLRFLDDAGVWTRMGGAPNIVMIQQAAAEACERVAAALRLREFHDQAPEVFASRIHYVLLEDGARDKDPTTEMQDFYSKPGTCERLLGSLAEYPKSLPMGSGAGSEAVLFVASVCAGFLEAALDCRMRIMSKHPTLLPPPESQQLQKYLSCAAPPPSGLGSNWLMSSCMKQALEKIRLVCLEVLPSTPVQGLPLLDAQALRIVDGLQKLSRGTLNAAHTTYGDLHGPQMVQIRRDVLTQLADAEASLAAPGGAPRTLQLAEEFEDFEALVSLTGSSSLSRLDEHMAKSESFRPHAFAQCLRRPQLHPLFFRLLRRFPPSQELLEELMAPYPELRWALDINGLDEASSPHQWKLALQKVKKAARENVVSQKKAVKRDVFVALATIAAAAIGGEDREDSHVADLACLGRLRRLCQRFGGDAQEHQTSADGPPLTVEECLTALCSCAREALVSLSGDGAEGQLLADAARLAHLAERGLAERRADLVQLLPKEPSAASAPISMGAGRRDACVAQALQRLWAEIILADEPLWKQILAEARDDEQRDTLISSTGYCRMLSWKRDSAQPQQQALEGVASLLRSAGLEELCAARPELGPLKPALRLAEARALASLPSA